MKKKISSLLMCFTLLSISSCNNNGTIYEGEYITELKYKFYEDKINDRNNFIGFIADKEDLRYEMANKIINNYYKYYSDTNIYRLDITKNEDNYIDNSINDNVISNLSTLLLDYNCSDIINSLVLYQNGLIYRAINFSEFIYEENAAKKLYNYINNLNEYSIPISAVVDETLNAVTEIEVDTVKTKIDNNDSFLLMVGQTTCSYCASCKLDINNYVFNTKKKIYLLNLKKGDKEFLQDKLNINVLYTPTFITFKKGKIVNFYIGCYTDSQLNSILQTEGILG